MEDDKSVAWKRLMAWAPTLTDRDISDEAHRWAADEAARVGFPENVGELKAMLAVAFDAGQQFMTIKSGRT